jgi:hypothetical protein
MRLKMSSLPEENPKGINTSVDNNNNHSDNLADASLEQLGYDAWFHDIGLLPNRFTKKIVEELKRKGTAAKIV